MPCPPYLDWYPEVNKCYSVKPHTAANWSAAVEECKKSDPEAKLMEPRNDQEVAIMAEIAGKPHTYSPASLRVIYIFTDLTEMLSV